MKGRWTAMLLHFSCTKSNRFSRTFMWGLEIYMFSFFFFMVMLLNSQKGQDTREPEKQNSDLISWVWTDFLLPSPPNTHHHSPLGPLILPACFGLVRSKWVAMEAERESERDRECAVLTSEEALTAVAWGVHGFVWNWVCRRGGQYVTFPPPPNTNLDGLPACMACAQKTRQAENPAGHQQLSATLRRL